jgi:glycerophosphoryl diester phosphodiesterase
MRSFEIVAHRGAPERGPENTIAAFQQALEGGADAVELDVRLSKDGVPVVFHHFYLDGPTNATGPVFAFTLAELQQVELLGGRGEPQEQYRIPALREVLEVFGGQLGFEIELKGPEGESAEILARELHSFRQLWDEMEVTSFEPALLLDIGRRCPGLNTDLIQRRSEHWMRWDAVAHIAIHSARLAHARAVHLYPDQLSPEVVDAVRSAGLEVHSGEINDLGTLSRVTELGIPKFDTDNLPLALEFRDGLES